MASIGREKNLSAISRAPSVICSGIPWLVTNQSIVSDAEYPEATVDPNHKRSQLGYRRFVFHQQSAFDRQDPGSSSPSSLYVIKVSATTRRATHWFEQIITYMIGISSKSSKLSAMLTSDIILIKRLSCIGYIATAMVIMVLFGCVVVNWLPF